MNGKIVGVSGNVSRPSRTRALVQAAVELAAARYGREPVVIEITASFGAASRLADLDEAASEAVEQILQADALVLASPICKGGYSGLFKHLLDLIDPLALAGKPVLLGATGGDPRHAVAIEHQMRPLLGFFEAQTLATGVYASDADFRGDRIVSTAVLDRIERAVGQFAPFLRPRRTPVFTRPAALAAAGGASA